jgi:hypothetical protein
MLLSHYILTSTLPLVITFISFESEPTSISPYEHVSGLHCPALILYHPHVGCLEVGGQHRMCCPSPSQAVSSCMPSHVAFCASGPVRWTHCHPGGQLSRQPDHLHDVVTITFSLSVRIPCHHLTHKTHHQVNWRSAR